MNLPFTPTYSSISTYITCPKMFYAKYVSKEVKFEPTPATEFGTMLHLKVENYLSKGMVDTDNSESFYADINHHFNCAKNFIDQYISRASSYLVEHEFNVGHDLSPLPWSSKNGLFRTKLDLLMINQSGVAIIADWKTGKFDKRYFTKQQLLWATVPVFSTLVDLNKIYLRYVFTANGHLEKGIVERNQVYDIANEIARISNDIWVSYNNEEWMPRKNGLCKAHCPVLSCRHNGNYTGDES